MKTKFFLLTILAFSTIAVFGQKETKKLDVRVGSGVSLLGSGDVIAYNYETELNYLLNNYISSSLSIDFGGRNMEENVYSNFIQANVNLFVHPFRNNRIVDLRIGTGLSYLNISDSFMSSAHYVDGVLVDVNYRAEQRKSWGVNIIIENTYRLSDQILIGVKLFSQPYFNGDINSGALLKLGYIF